MAHSKFLCGVLPPLWRDELELVEALLKISLLISASR